MKCDTENNQENVRTFYSKCIQFVACELVVSSWGCHIQFLLHWKNAHQLCMLPVRVHFKWYTSLTPKKKEAGDETTHFDWTGALLAFKVISRMIHEHKDFECTSYLMQPRRVSLFPLHSCISSLITKPTSFVSLSNQCGISQSTLFGGQHPHWHTTRCLALIPFVIAQAYC